MSETSENGDERPRGGIEYRTNGHEFKVQTEFDGDEMVQCNECKLKELIREDDDAKDHLELMTPECHIEWLRKPDGGFRGIALRNGSGFSGRQLIAVDSDGEITDTVRVYDDDAGLLASMLDKSQWEKIENVE